MATAFITGAGVRVGSAVARALGHAGYDLALHAHRSVSSLEVLAGELRALGRRVWVCPADLSSPQGVDELGARVRAEHPVLDVVVPMGREGSVEDVARVVMFLAREAPYITGQVIAVDGGRSAQL